MGKKQKECFTKAYDTAADLILKATDEFAEKFPPSASVDHFYQPGPNRDWTAGFWTGEVWLAWEKTGNEKLKKTAEIDVKDFYRRIKERDGVDHHDMGFLYCPSCVAAWKLTGNTMGKEAALMAADNLMGRFQEKGQFFQAWGELGAKDNYRLIIDCLMNMPLLFWATEVTGDQKYAEKAQAHIKTAMQNIIRPDNSTYHTFFFDPETGAPVKGVTHQGYRDGSAWARGQAWGVYGSALAYKFLKNDAYVDIFCRVTDYFLEHLPEDKIPYWDFDFTDGSDEPRDSSSAAIAACGMLEMSKYLPQEKARHYTEKAEELVEALIRECAVTDPAVSNGLLLHGTYAKSSPYNTCPDLGVDECVIWGDYFYMEALTRLLRDWEPYWY
ncbi:MAG TPA: glycoside hydrolase family 88 protein [Candidatus Eisenbergiella merdipullorum]|uniref:Glycoside hydrolase family 88 protein n=1 Tax=Candidatus Eisenbergiella merdipullorum TaxID=2838553 RepID=A0A9D2L0Q9_9FIRM|nr:glycoside hydrolase family 88 protein [Candidatus Eisenbergiella merdipullorum]